MEQIRLTHVDIGELYLEFTKCEAEDCSFCSTIPGQTIPSIPRPIPNLNTNHYKTLKETGLQKRIIDEFQPRFQCKKLFEDKKLSTSNPEQMKTFSEKFLVKPSVVSEYLNHLEDLIFKKEKRKEASQAKKNAASNLTHPENEEQEEENNHENFTDSDNEMTLTNDDEDRIMNIIDGSDNEEADDEEVVIVPKLRTLTRGGRLAGTWQTCFSLDEESDTDEESDDETKSANSDQAQTDNDNSDEENDSEDSDTPDEEKDSGHSDNPDEEKDSDSENNSGKIPCNCFQLYN